MVGELFLRGTAIRYRRGSIKEPLFSMLGQSRTWLDIVLNLSTVGVALKMLLTPEPSARVAAAYLACLLAQHVSDWGVSIGSFGYFHVPHAAILLYRYAVNAAGALVLTQLFLMMVYVSCGLCKMGPWFSCVFAQEWTTPPWAFGLTNFFFKDARAHGDYRITRFGKALAYVAATIECGTWLSHGQRISHTA